MDTGAILRAVEHRPRPLPKKPWVMTQIWHELLFAHWPLAPESVRALIPPVLTLDTFEQQAWIGIVPFRMSDVRPRLIPPLPWLSQFPELNVRTYVIVNGFPGVYFFSLDAANPIAVAAARSLFHLPYFNARMSTHRASDETIDYHSQRRHRGALPAELKARYRPTAPAAPPLPGTLEHWLTERYCLYTVVGERIYRGDIHHMRWPLQSAEWDVTSNTMAQAHSIPLPDIPPLLHYAHQQDVLIWPLQHIAPH